MVLIGKITNNNMWVINNRKIFYFISITLVVLSLVALYFWGLKPSIDFTGGTIIDTAYQTNVPSQDEVAKAVSAFDSGASVRTSGEGNYIIRLRSLSQDEHISIFKALTINGKFQPIEKTYDSIGPTLGVEALRKALVSIALVILGIVLYITFAFRKVSQPVSSWKYGLVAIIALIHDVIIPTGFFSLFGHVLGYEVDTLFITALLVVLGFSVHDTIVVFDRVRENLKNSSEKKPFDQIVGESISQTFVRSINTSLTTLIALIVLYFVGSASTEHFSLALIIGIAAGTYSSIFVGSPLLVSLEKWQRKKKK